MRGRPTKMTNEMVTNLKLCFSQWLNDIETCCYCQISKSTFYLYLETHPDLREIREILNQNIKMKAKMNIYKEINDWNLGVSKWYLEKFSNNVNDARVRPINPLSQHDKELLAKVLKENL